MPRSLTSIGVVWIVSSVVCSLLCCASFYLPYWIEGTTLGVSVHFGIFRRCNFLTKSDDGSSYVMQACGRYASFNDIPSTAWRACAVLIGMGCGLLLLVCLTAICSCCMKDIMTKASTKVAGAIQFFAAFLLAISVAAYPSGWGSLEVRQACGSAADSYSLGNCRLGWTFYIFIIGTVIAFVCAGLSIKAGRPRPHSQTDHLNNYVL